MISIASNKYFDLSLRDVTNEYNSTLHYLVLKNHFRVLERLLLIFKGTESLQINAKNHKNKTPLHIACELGHEESIKILVENEADLNLWDINKNTPLHLICKTGNVELLPYFLHNPKLDLRAKDKDGKMAY